MTAPYQVGGGLPLDAPTYVERQADQDFYSALRRGDYCYVLNSRQMGKTSLRARTMARLQADKMACAALDLAEIGTEQLTPTEWYAGLVDLLAEAFPQQMAGFDLGSWWEAQHPLSPLQRFGKFLREELLERVSQPIVIFIDEVDSVLSLGFSHDDFFALVRECYNRRTDQPAYRRLTFALLGVATPADLIQDNDRTPFNIGRSIQLTGFTPEEATPLAEGLTEVVANPQSVLAEILHWTEGQPFLTQKLCDAVVQTTSPDTELLPVVSTDDIARLVQTQIVDHWESNDDPPHLRTIQDRILSNEQRANRLLGLYREIVQQGSIAYDGSPSQVDLRLSGLVVERQNRLGVYNPIYQRVFDANWVAQAFTKLRPYAAAIAAWEASGRDDDGYLLQGNALDEALVWAENRTLGRTDYQFLVESQSYSLRQDLEQANFELNELTDELAEKIQTLQQAEAELEGVNRELAATHTELSDARLDLSRVQRNTRRWSRIGLAVLATALVGLGISAVEARRQTQFVRAADAEATLERRQATNQKVTAGLEVGGLQFQKVGLEMQRSDLQSQAEVLNTQNNDLTTANQQISQQVSEAETARLDALAQFEQISGQLGDVQIDLDERTRQLTTRNQELMNLTGQVSTLSQQTESLDREVKTLEQDRQDVIEALQQAIGTLGLQRVRNVYYQVGGFDNAIDYLKGSRDNAYEIQDLRGAGYANGNLGTVYTALGNYTLATEHHQQHLDIARQVQDRQGTMQAEGNLAEVVYRQGRYQEAIPALEQYLATARENQDKLEECRALAILGRAYLGLGQPDMAMEYHQQSLALAKDVVKDKRLEGEVQSYMGDVYFSRGEYQTAMAYYTKHMEIATAIDDQLGIEEAHRNQAKVHRSLGDNEKAIAGYTASRAIAEDIKNRQGQAAALAGLGEIYYSTYGHESALKTYTEALALAREIDDRGSQAQILNRIGQVYGRQSQYEDALARYQEANRIYQAVGDRAGEGTTLNNIGLVYDNQGNYGEALRYYEESLAIRRAVGDRAGEGTTLNNIGAVYDNQSNYGEALRYYEESLAILRAVGDRAGEGATLNNIGVSYAFRGLNTDTLSDFLQAVPYLQEGFVIAVEIGNPVDAASSQSSLRNVLVEIQKRDATEYQRQCQQTAAATGLPITEWCP